MPGLPLNKLAWDCDLVEALSCELKLFTTDVESSIKRRLPGS